MVETWIAPCNIKRFDITGHFSHANRVVMKKAPGVALGDVVYIYLSAPVSAIMYKCAVINNAVTADEAKKLHPYAVGKDAPLKSGYMELELLGSFERGELPLALLKENGLGQVQIQARADRKLKRFLDTHEKRFVKAADNG